MSALEPLSASQIESVRGVSEHFDIPLWGGENMLRAFEDAMTHIHLCGSPIEEKMAKAISGVSYGFVPIIWAEAADRAARVHRAWARSVPVIIVQQQKQIGPYRADFLLSMVYKEEQIAMLVVECDGHDFHERTKEQAARDRKRDRWFTQHSLSFLRFTGSEIHRNPFQCTDEIGEALLSFWGAASNG